MPCSVLIFYIAHDERQLRIISPENTQNRIGSESNNNKLTA
jgi:hypothetical protein